MRIKHFGEQWELLDWKKLEKRHRKNEGTETNRSTYGKAS